MNIKEMQERKNDLITRAEEILNKAKAETRDLTEEEMAILVDTRDKVTKIVNAMELDDFFENAEEKRPKEEAKPIGGEKEPMKTEKQVAEERAINDRHAFENYLRGRVVHERAGEMTKTDNGAVIPTTIADTIIRKVYEICPVLERSRKFTVKGKLDIPFYPADANNITVAYASEFTALTSSSGKFDKIELSGFLAGCLTKVSRSLVNNAQFNIVDFVVDEMANAIKRWIENELLNGTTNKIDGLSTLTNGVTAASTTALTADEIIELKDKVKDEFQNDAIWIMSPATRTALRLLKDDVGRYLLQDDITSPFGTTLLGKPVYVSDNMSDIAAGKTAIYYGDMSGLATKFSEEINIEVLRERFADEHALGVVGWLEMDAKVCDEQRLACLKMASA